MITYDGNLEIFVFNDFKYHYIKTTHRQQCNIYYQHLTTRNSSILPSNDKAALWDWNIAFNIYCLKIYSTLLVFNNKIFYNSNKMFLILQNKIQRRWKWSCGPFFFDNYIVWKSWKNLCYNNQFKNSIS